MPTFNTDWTVLDHGPLEQLAENVWFVDGSLGGNNPLPRRMTIVRRDDGSLVLHNGVAVKR
jgi:hypothetical protein